MPNFIDDYLYYQSGNECHKSYHLWSALTLLSAVVGRRVYFDIGGANGYGQLRCNINLLTCLIGPQGGRKSVAKDMAKDLLMEIHPTYPIANSVETREGICKFLGSEEAMRYYTDENGQTVEWRPFFMPPNELKNFLSVNPVNMIDFLVDISDRKVYNVRTKGAGDDYINNPCLSMLACATTDYVTGELKEKTFSGGLARRVLFINETAEVTPNPEPCPPADSIAGWERVKKHLAEVITVAGPFKWATAEDKNFYNLWYMKKERSTDALMAGFERSEHFQMLRVAMLYAMAEYEPKLVLTRELISKAIKTINSIKPGMAKLFQASGRNELMVPKLRLMEIIEKQGGLVAQKKLMRLAESVVSPIEYMSLERHLVDSGQIIRQTLKIDGVDRLMIILPDKLEELQKEQTK